MQSSPILPILKKLAVGFVMVLILAAILLATTAYNLGPDIYSLKIPFLSDSPTPTPSSGITVTNLTKTNITEAKTDIENSNSDNAANVMVVDIRNTVDYANGHIKDAVNMPLASIEAGTFALPKNNYQIIIYTNEEINEEKLVQKLSTKDVKSVEVLQADYSVIKDSFNTEEGAPKLERDPREEFDYGKPEPGYY